MSHSPQHENIQAIVDEARNHIVELIRIDTTNPPGNETAACEYLCRALAAEGIESVTLESAPGRGNLVARLKGNGEKRPLMIASHVDVVAANADDWESPPFAGEIRDGFIWGRGALDCKQQTAFELMVMIEIRRRGLELKRDLIFCANADEENSGVYGMNWMVENHFELIDCEYAINEGGGHGLPVGGRRVYPVQNSEKGSCWLRLTTEGAPGHGSMPKPDNPILHMIQALERVAKPMPVTRTSAVESILSEVAALVGLPPGLPIGDLAFNPRAVEFLIAALRLGNGQAADLISAMMRNTVAPTIIHAGRKQNVIPARCEAVIDCRLLPGQDPDEFRELIEQLARVDSVEPAEALITPGSESPIHTELYRAIRATLAEHDPGSMIIPFMAPGATDNRFLRYRGITAYGFCPMRTAHKNLGELMKSVHGVNERLPLDTIEFSFKAFFDLVVRMCC